MFCVKLTNGRVRLSATAQEGEVLFNRDHSLWGPTMGEQFFCSSTNAASTFQRGKVLFNCDHHSLTVRSNCRGGGGGRTKYLHSSKNTVKNILTWRRGSNLGSWPNSLKARRQQKIGSAGKNSDSCSIYTLDNVSHSVLYLLNTGI